MLDNLPQPDYLIFFDYDHATKSIIESILYSRSWFIRSITKVDESITSEALFCYTLDETNVKSEALYILQKTNLRHCFISLSGKPSIITRSNELISLAPKSDDWDSEPTLLYFIIQNTPFIFKKEKNFHLVTLKEELNNGDLVQIRDGEVWIDTIVENIDEQWKKLYSILSKYGRVRIEKI